MEAGASTLESSPGQPIDESLLPPRPDLSRFMMMAGFMLRPTRFLDACQERCGDYFTLRPERDRLLVVTADPAAVKQVFTGDPDLLYAGEGNVVARAAARPRLDAAARRRRAPAPSPAAAAALPRRADAQVRRGDGRGRRAPDRRLAPRASASPSCRACRRSRSR